MRKIGCLLLFVVFLGACSNENNPKEHLGEITAIALESLMEKDKALSSDVNYIALDFNNIERYTDLEVKEIQGFLEERYKVEVIKASLEELKKKGLYNLEEMGLEDGVLLKIEKINFKWFNTVHFETSKFRSAKGAIGVETTIQFKEGKWKMKESTETWIS
ncbi:peptide ABC transporter substrate-binding protein [Neobacillus niacini]|jgi:hypothetical protein|uniref:peptide ABC transporter substrate-binding protein n=1 Tax=Neobacillus niacini TaxID=86668 RepID=UPI001C8E9123|nr:peptide ABC transporter substrate-binding protein [Neobacillus niacini]MBY0149096.1 peptide ABC transporter substrate-binding protein [Neobacillus niacini]